MLPPHDRRKRRGPMEVKGANLSRIPLRPNAWAAKADLTYGSDDWFRCRVPKRKSWDVRNGSKPTVGTAEPCPLRPRELTYVRLATIVGFVPKADVNGATCATPLWMSNCRECRSLRRRRSGVQELSLVDVYGYARRAADFLQTIPGGKGHLDENLRAGGHDTVANGCP
jgi:hypothetical protein